MGSRERDTLEQRQTEVKRGRERPKREKLADSLRRLGSVLGKQPARADQRTNAGTREFLADRWALMELYNAIGGDWIFNYYYISLFEHERGFLLSLKSTIIYRRCSVP